MPHYVGFLLILLQFTLLGIALRECRKWMKRQSIIRQRFDILEENARMLREEPSAGRDQIFKENRERFEALEKEFNEI